MMAVDVMWGTDMSQTVTSVEGVAHVFVAAGVYRTLFFGHQAALCGHMRGDR
jgi:hypothetical protein